MGAKLRRCAIVGVCITSRIVFIKRRTKAPSLQQAITQPVNGLGTKASAMYLSIGKRARQ